MKQKPRFKPRKDASSVDALLARHGGLSYIEIPAIDPRRSVEFYEKVLGWRIQDSESDHPKFMDQTGHLLGRWVTGRTIPRSPGLMPYFYVQFIEEAISCVAANGGTIAKAQYAEGNLWVATIRDPAGNLIGLWQERD